MRRIQVEASKLGKRLFRNNVGMGWAGKSFIPHKPTNLTVFPGDVVIRDARPLHSGLGEGSSDLIGWTPLKITPDMVGKTVAIFTACEVKTQTGRLKQSQKKFLDVVNAAGGLGICARNVEDATR